MSILKVKLATDFGDDNPTSRAVLFLIVTLFNCRKLGLLNLELLRVDRLI